MGYHSLSELFNERLYVELQNHTAEDLELCVSLTTLAHRLHLPTVATHDIHYLTAEQAHLQQVQTAIRLIRPLKELDPTATAPSAGRIHQPAGDGRTNAKFPAGIGGHAGNRQPLRAEATIRVCCTSRKSPTRRDKSGEELLRQKAQAGAIRLYGQITARPTSPARA